MRYQIMIFTGSESKPASEVLNTLEEAKNRLVEVKTRIRVTQEKPDENAAYIAAVM